MLRRSFQCVNVMSCHGVVVVLLWRAVGVCEADVGIMTQVNITRECHDVSQQYDQTRSEMMKCSNRLHAGRML